MDLTALCRCAQASYWPPGATQPPLGAGELDPVQLYHEHDVVIVRQRPGYLNVTIRGSDDFWDWVDNLRAYRITTELGGIHSGFWDRAHTIARIIARRIPRATSTAPPR